MTAAKLDIHQAITDQIVTAIENGAPDFKMPWHRSRGSLMRPVNVSTGNAYQGVNVLSLWVAAEVHGYSTPIWGTYRQWQAKGAQVRKGEKASLVVFYKELEFERENAETGQSEEGKTLFARASHVFNAAQVDGFELPEPEDAPKTIIESLADADALIAASGAIIREGGEKAFYRPSDDTIALPDRFRFTGTETMSPQEAFYATALHELTHWTGAKHRLDRNFAGRFGSESYAFEELIAELGASYLCAHLGITTELRPDHAAYIANWLKVLKGDKKAIFTAASQADKAARFLLAFGDLAPTPTRPDMPSEPPDPVDELGL